MIIRLLSLPILFALLLPGAEPLRCRRTSSASPTAADWKHAEPALLERTSTGEGLPQPLTEVRTLWNGTHLLIRFLCPYKEFNLRAAPNPKVETFGLWDYDVAEVFAGSDFTRIGRYKEFEVSPQGDWVDLEVDRDRKGKEADWKWNSDFRHTAHIDRKAAVWSCEMHIPLASLEVPQPQAGTRLRINFYRIEGKGENRTLMTWRPTGARSFHVPAAFGELVLTE